MTKYIIIGIIILAVAVVTYMFFKRKEKSIPEEVSQLPVRTDEGKVSNYDQPVAELSIQMEMLPLSELGDTSELTEIKDSKVLARINNLIPGMGQAGVATANAVKAGGETVYRAIIPAGAKLTDSKAMES